MIIVIKGGKDVIWIIPCNLKKYDLIRAFENYDFIYWHKSKQLAKSQPGDIVYIYCGQPYQKIVYRCKIEKIVKRDVELDVDFDKALWKNERDYILNKKYEEFLKIKQVDWVNTESLKLNYLIDNGLKKAPQGPMKLENKPKLLDYIKRSVNEYKNKIYRETEMNEVIKLVEGKEMEQLILRRERNIKARDRAIELHGVSCSVCGVNFEDIYGELGKNFIEIHHIKPISNQKGEYEINPEKDLIPVCSNCHSMLHRQINGENVSVEKLKEIVLERKNRRKL